MEKQKIKVLLEMRPALEGFAGIPQEVRLLFRGLRKIKSVDVEGMLQTSHRKLAKGLTKKSKTAIKKYKEADNYRKLSNVVISLAEKPYRNMAEIIADFFLKKIESVLLRANVLIGGFPIKMGYFESSNFEDFIWRTLFSKTLPATDFNIVARSKYYINRVPWRQMHLVGLRHLNFSTMALYPKLDTSNFDVFIGQTPYPARFSKNTKIVIRYHDAIPVFMPHTIPEKSIHQATHFYALMSNVRSGAWFACVSEATRQDLIRLFPEAEKQSVVIHNMVSNHYFNEESPRSQVSNIIRSRIFSGEDAKGAGLEPEFLSVREKENFYRRYLEGEVKYIMMVSTIEPRKNHIRLIAAWEVLKSEIDVDLKLVIVGTLGWDNAQIIRACRPWIERGELFMLNAVPAPDLRVLYRHAAATVCPSLGEGFDFSGVESMASGGITIASDIAVHREVYDDAAEYFDPYSTSSLVAALKKVLYAPDAEAIQARMRLCGREVAARYQPERILPQWENFLQRITHTEMLGEDRK